MHWEYWVVTRSRNFATDGGAWNISGDAMLATLADAGAQGWELVSVYPRQSLVNYKGMTSEEIWVFKRPVDTLPG
ncbi:MAG: hypothetical protein DCC58_10950 [Chloroflexi bacterium]|nr:MAG: hypothetical protein DCC58_10950 [Chloroflexota bacterium]